MSQDHLRPTPQVPIVPTQAHQAGKVGEYYECYCILSRAHIQEGAVNVVCPSPYRPGLSWIMRIVYSIGNAEEERLSSVETHSSVLISALTLYKVP